MCLDLLGFDQSRPVLDIVQFVTTKVVTIRWYIILHLYSYFSLYVPTHFSFYKGFWWLSLLEFQLQPLPVVD